MTLLDNRPRPADPRLAPRRPGPPPRRPGPPSRPHRPVSLPKVGEPLRRQGVLTALGILVLLAFAARLVWVQAIASDELAAQALSSRLVTVALTEPRADIVDRNGTVLATTVDRYHIWVNQQKLQQWQRTSDGVVTASGPHDAAAILAPILDMDPDELEYALTGDATFKYIAKDVSRDTTDLIRDEQIYGIDWEPTSERLYPNGNIAGNVVGFMGGRSDKQGEWGLAGLELAFEDQMMGTPGELVYERSRENVVIPTGVQEETPAIPGQTVVTTLDRDLQWYTQSRLDKAVSDSGAEWGVVVVMDTKTGQIYSLADSDTVDPSDPGASSATDRGSRAVSAVFEPGSTGKIVTMAALIEEGLATPTSEFRAPYAYTTDNDQTFHDSHSHPTLKLTLTGILAKSSNTGTVIAGSRLDRDTRYEYLKAFGFGDATGAGLPGESPGILRDAADWDGRTKYAVLFGQGLSVNALQVTQVYQAIANGGVLVPPTVVSGFENADGTFEPRVNGEPRRVVSEETANELMTMLESVVEEGTGGKANVDGYRIAGKTGTAQAAGPSGQMDSIVASFVGIAPADDPRIVVSVILYNPKSSIYGGTVAAPVFADVTGYALQALGVAPSDGEPTLYPITWE